MTQRQRWPALVEESKRRCELRAEVGREWQRRQVTSELQGAEGCSSTLHLVAVCSVRGSRSYGL